MRKLLIILALAACHHAHAAEFHVPFKDGKEPRMHALVARYVPNEFAGVWERTRVEMRSIRKLRFQVRFK